MNLNRRQFFVAFAGVIVPAQRFVRWKQYGVDSQIRELWPKPVTQRIGYILDEPHTIRTITGELVTCGDGSEYFFAHTAEQDKQLRSAANNITPLFPIHGIDSFSKYVHKGTGVFVCDDHGVKGGSNFVPFACVILLPGSAGDPAFDVIRKTAERWP